MQGVCGAATSVQGVRVVCDRVQGHAGAHRSPIYGCRWKDTGELMQPPPPAPAAAPPKCTVRGCTLWSEHAGPHGKQGGLW